MVVNNDFLTFSMVIDWENAVLSELDRTRWILKQLHKHSERSSQAACG